MDQRQKTYFHIDVNSAFLSWEAVDRLKTGSKTDLRLVPSVVGGDESSRKGIVLAKSYPAKQYNIITGETLYAARQKCPHLIVVPPRHELYAQYSEEMLEFLEQYSPVIEKYSIDECFLEYTGLSHLWGDCLQAAHMIKDSIKEKLGFTVNIGISYNRLLAKMAGEFSKSDKVHTLWLDEIPAKLWPLPVEELYMVGRANVSRLHSLGIRSIGDLAGTAPERIKKHLKSYGEMIWNYARGVEDPEIFDRAPTAKGIGSSMTTPEDIKDAETACRCLLSLAETVGFRLREGKHSCSIVMVGLKDSAFRYYSHQRKLPFPTNSTREIYETAKDLFKEMWRGEPLRLLGLRVAKLSPSAARQMTLFAANKDKQNALDEVIDSIRSREGQQAVIRATLLCKNSNEK